MNYVLEVLENSTAPIDDERFRSGAVRGSAALSITSLLDIATSMVMMTVRNPDYEGNVVFRQLYIHPAVSNLLCFIQDQLFFIIPIILGFLVPFITQRISLPDNISRYTGLFGYPLRVVLIGFAGLRIYGTYTNILATLIDLPFGDVATVLIFTLALFYLLKYSLAFDLKVSNDV